LNYRNVLGSKQVLNISDSESKLLIVGIDGTIGSKLFSTLPTYGWTVYGTSRDKSRTSSRIRFLDLESPDLDLHTEKFSVAIICAAITSIYQCEKYPSESRDINVIGTIALIDSLLQSGTFVVFLSTNAIFDGSKAFYSITDTPNPLNKYGSFKLEVEEHLLKKKNANFAILRLTKLITNQTKLIVTWNLLVEQKNIILAFSNRMLSPITMEEVESAISSIISTKQTGVFHLGGQVELSYFDFAKQYFGGQPISLSLIRDSIDPLIPPKEIQHNSLFTLLPKY
jgi:dTDP-4-dehydrorhamnose reductase